MPERNSSHVVPTNKPIFWNGTLKPEFVLSDWCQTHEIKSPTQVFRRYISTKTDTCMPIISIETGDRIDIKSTRPERSATPFARPEGTWFSGIAAWCIKQATRFKSARFENNLDVVRTYIESFKNEQDFAVFPKLFAPHFVHHFDYLDAPDDFRTWVTTGQDFLRGFPNVQVEILSLEQDGDLVVEHNIARGTHDGHFRGTDSTGREVSWEEIHIYRLDGGRIVENWPMVDYDAIDSQIA